MLQHLPGHTQMRRQDIVILQIARGLVDRLGNRIIVSARDNNGGEARDRFVFGRDASGRDMTFAPASMAKSTSPSKSLIASSQSTGAGLSEIFADGQANAVLD